MTNCAPKMRTASRSIRRANLLIGLAMTPWVLLYAIGFVVDRVSRAKSGQIYSFDTAPGVQGPKVALPGPASLAAITLIEANRSAEKQGRAKIYLHRPSQARYLGNHAQAKVVSPSRQYLVDLDLRTGKLRAQETGLATNGLGGPTLLVAADQWKHQTQDEIVAAFKRHGIHGTLAEVVSSPTLVFTAIDDREQELQLEFNPIEGVLRPHHDSTALRFASNDASADLGLYWSLPLNAFILGLLVWSACNALVWSRNKPARRSGALVLVVSGTVAAAILVAHYFLVAE